MTKPLDIEPTVSSIALLRCQPVTRAELGRFCSLGEGCLEHRAPDRQMITGHAP